MSTLNKKNTRKVYSLIVAVAVVVGGYSIYAKSQSEASLSLLALANVEALASGETDAFDCAAHNCWVNFDYDCLYPVGGVWRVCFNMKGGQ